MTGLLSLIRPFRWQHLWLPYVPITCAAAIAGAIGANETFIIGCHPQTHRIMREYYSDAPATSGKDTGPATVVHIDDRIIQWGTPAHSELEINRHATSLMLPYSTRDMHLQWFEELQSTENLLRLPTRFLLADTVAAETKMSDKVAKLREVVMNMFVSLLTFYPVALQSDGLSLAQHLLTERYITPPDAAPFVAKLTQRSMFTEFLQKQAGESKSDPDVEPFENKFHKNVGTELRLSITQHSMLQSLTQESYLHICVMDMRSPGEPGCPEYNMEKTLKLKEKRRWVTLDRQRLTLQC